MLDSLPRLRKFGINTTGLTPHRAIPMVTKVAELCHERGIIFSTRVSIDGVGEMHNKVRKVKSGFDKALKTIRAMQELQKRVPFNFGISTTIFSMNLDDAENILAWARKEKLDIVFNMVRFTEPMLGNAEPRRHLQADRAGRRADAAVLPRARPHGSAARRPELHLHALRRHDRQRLPPPGAVPVPDAGDHAQPERRPVLLREQRRRRQRARRGCRGASTSAQSSQAHRDSIKDEKCPTCLSPCQMNVVGREAGGAVREVPRPRVAREAETPGEFGATNSKNQKIQILGDISRILLNFSFSDLSFYITFQIQAPPRGKVPTDRNRQKQHRKRKRRGTLLPWRARKVTPTLLRLHRCR